LDIYNARIFGYSNSVRRRWSRGGIAKESPCLKKVIIIIFNIHLYIYIIIL
jgi:hypothetical protein